MADKRRFLMTADTSSRVGLLLLSSRTLADMMKPGVQMPHCAPP
jgi:hypothetical protein